MTFMITEDIWYPKRKIISLDKAKQIIFELKKDGKKVGFTNGCFDCCHLGHLSSFLQAKQHCDILVVGVNSDACVKSYKGENRPIQDEKTRAMLLACLEFIDFVIIFDDRTALPLVEALKPDIIAKEGYSLDKWPEGQFVQSYGGQAITLERIDGYSTSELIKKMQ
ncbi:MAG: D-glycero-beta-D-manno-heptose 1-phosphate adenylyltransferase [Alphaproteobacteria bacterium]|nr:D-glycero-beta-D-manno-heptose 1-phosphate adenylyltransferase [Alphaproteobacteria bacterium]